jgi:hypothetical protein
MNDKTFLQQFENCTLPNELFKHREHIRLAWIYLSNHPLEQAVHLTGKSILRFATSLGGQAKYHETLTQIWVYLVDAAMQRKNAATYDEFILLHPELFDKDLPQQYYSFPLLENELARKQWIAPDLKQGSNLRITQIVKIRNA